MFKLRKQRFFAFTLLFVMIGFSTSLVSAGLEEQSSEVIEPQRLSVQIAKAIAHVYSVYPQSAKYRSCTEYSYEVRAGYIYVSVYSKNAESEKSSDEILVTAGAGNSCAPHLIYRFNSSGDFVSRRGVR